MEEVDWEKNPPRELIVEINLRTGRITHVHDNTGMKSLKIKHSLYYILASGSPTIDIILGDQKPFLEYKKTKELTQYVKDKGKEVTLKYLTYKIVNE